VRRAPGHLRERLLRERELGRIGAALGEEQLAEGEVRLGDERRLRPVLDQLQVGLARAGQLALGLVRAPQQPQRLVGAPGRSGWVGRDGRGAPLGVQLEARGEVARPALAAAATVCSSAVRSPASVAASRPATAADRSSRYAAATPRICAGRSGARLNVLCSRASRSATSRTITSSARPVWTSPARGATGSGAVAGSGGDSPAGTARSIGAATQAVSAPPYPAPPYPARRTVVGPRASAP
jgi:hypothetical protein